MDEHKCTLLHTMSTQQHMYIYMYRHIYMYVRTYVCMHVYMHMHMDIKHSHGIHGNQEKKEDCDVASRAQNCVLHVTHRRHLHMPYVHTLHINVM
jgi:hypothetical protein